MACSFTPYTQTVSSSLHSFSKDVSCSGKATYANFQPTSESIRYSRPLTVNSPLRAVRVRGIKGTRKDLQSSLQV